MALPFFSIDLNTSDIFNLIKNIFLPNNNEKSKNEILSILNKRFPDKEVCLLPSARLGFYLSLKNYFKENDEIIFSAMSFPLYVKIANQLKLKVKLVDVNKNDLNISLRKLRECINTKTKGIVVTHLFGYPCEILEIKKLAEENKIILIEDCAQSFGSYYENLETGNFGNVGIFSCSLVKIPTTLGGGILISSDKNLKIFIDEWINENLKNNLVKSFKLLFKNIISILNSFPAIYTILSSKIFFFLNKFNPRIYRKIVYSGMGVRDKIFDPCERPNLSKYQTEIGISQLKRVELMKNKRIENSNYIKSNLINIDGLNFLEYHKDINWNYQYFIIKIEKNFDKFNKFIFNNGIHAMEENVWNCLEYNYKIENFNDDFNETKVNNPKILRIQNSSSLKKKDLDKIIQVIKKAINEI